MIIGLDGNEANIENRVGVNVYAFELLTAISKLQENWKNKHTIIVYLKRNPLPDMPRETKNFKYKILPGRKIWILTRLTPYLLPNPDKLDLFFTPSHYLPLILKIPSVCSIMDLGYLNSSEQFKKYDFWQLKYWTASSLQKAKKIIAISESTKKDILRHYPNTAKKIEVTLLAYDKNKFNQKTINKDVRQVKNKYHINKNYILFLGTLKPSKNIEGLLLAFAKISKEFPDIELVISGKKGWLFESIFHKAKELNLENRVIFTGFVDEKDKPSLIGSAKIFCLPSFWEGFGLDVLNALASGVPCIISDRGSLPEVGGLVALYADPQNTDSIAYNLKKVLSMKKVEYNKLSRNSAKWAQKFDWEKTANKTLKILESI
ncbi:MAG: glycosyltransferase family 4 protein [Candidatus Woesebacteria bacterium]|nr:MAG: glycosyltransferase family 4 protein [Candidatus Woesebacteria bacterium]